MRFLRKQSPLLLAAALLAGCAGLPQTGTLAVPDSARTLEDHILYSPTTWSGAVRVTRPVIVTKTASLTLQPGTHVYFDIPEPAPNQDRRPWILVLGTLVALGSTEAPITFSAVALHQSELDDMLQFQQAKEAHFRHCIFERGPWAMHLHDTPVEIADSVFLANYGGIRFQKGSVVIRGSRFEDNRIGVRCLNGSPRLEGNTFSGNLTGIFFREGVAEAFVRRNNFDNEEYDIKLGEGQKADISAAENFWAAAAKGRLAEVIFDARDSEGLGSVRTDPVLDRPWTPELDKK